MGRAAVAKCQWFWWHPVDQKWVAEEEAPDNEASCRASIGQRWVTVWLPRGAMIRRRIPRHLTTLDGHEFRYAYGRDRDRQIHFTVTATPQNPPRKPSDNR